MVVGHKTNNGEETARNKTGFIYVFIYLLNRVGFMPPESTDILSLIITILVSETTSTKKYDAGNA